MSVIIPVGAGGRALLITADSAGRQREPPCDLTLVKAAAHPDAPLVDSVAARMRASIVEAGARPGVALNQAARLSAGGYLVFVPAGFTLLPSFLERSAALLEGTDASACAAAIRVQTPDGHGKAVWIPGGLTAAAVLTDPAGVPPVFVIQRSAWEETGGFDEHLDGLVEYELWLRLALSGRRLEAVPVPLVVREIGARPLRRPADDEEYLGVLRNVLAKHESALDGAMREVLVGRELRFGRAREAHRELLTRRDKDLAELDRLRAEAAHHRAYLEHHGQAALDWGDLRRLDPVSREWGYDRGVPVDRRYIDDFLAAHSSDIQGVVLEVQEDDFTIDFGGPRVAMREVLDIDAANSRATVLADLRCAPGIPSERFDCIILTQTLHVVDDITAALGECYRILRPGGVLLATFPAASRVCLEYGQEGDLWRMTPAGVRRLAHAAFGPSHASLDVFGNILTNTAFLHGLSAGELTDAEFDTADPYFPALTGLRARKVAAPERVAPRGIVLLYHRVDDEPGVHDLAVPAGVFEEHLQWLRAHCHLLPLQELLRTPAEALPARPVAITFDDGYLDNLTVAAPLLCRYGAPATFFVTSRWLDEPGEYWWDALERILLGGGSLPDSMPIDIAGAAELPTMTRGDRMAAHGRIHDVLVHASLADRDRIMAALLRWSGAAAAASVRRPMLAAEVRELSRMAGLQIGAHTVNHLALPDQPDEVQRAELSECRSVLASVTGRPIDQFAYPYGAVNRHVASAARRTFGWSVSCDTRPVGESFDAARVPRVEVKRRDARTFAAAIDRFFSAADPGPLITRVPE